MPIPRDPSTLMRAAHLYYVEDRSQAEIAADLGTSRSNVSRILDEAKRRGIVEIRLHDPSGRLRDLEDQLTATFGLSEARVAPRSTPHGSPGGGSTGRVGALAAELLLDNLADGATLALSWGEALQSMVSAVQTDVDHDVTVVQLLGGTAAMRNGVSGQELVRELAVRLGAGYRLLHAPATFESALAARTMLAESSLVEALDLARAADLAFVGIGDPAHGSSATVIESLALDEAEAAQFWSHDPVGDLAGRYVTIEGEPVRGAVDERIVSVSLDDLDRIPLVVGVASGRAKTRAVLGALRGRHVDGLVCDESLARGVLSAAGSPDAARPR